jgi:hypothetical protein
VLADRHGSEISVRPWKHPFGDANQTDKAGVARANYRSAGLADMIASLETGRPPRCGIDVALHTVDVMTSIARAADETQAITLTTTCERPAALLREDAVSLLIEHLSGWKHAIGRFRKATAAIGRAG